MFFLYERGRSFVQCCDRNILIPTTLCFILGTITGRLYPSVLPQTSVLFALALLAAAILSLYFTSTKSGLFLCLPLFFLIGHLNTVHQV